MQRMFGLLSQPLLQRYSDDKNSTVHHKVHSLQINDISPP